MPAIQNAPLQYLLTPSFNIVPVPSYIEEKTVLQQSLDSLI